MKLLSILAVSALLFSCNNTKEVIDTDPINVKKAQIGDVSQESAHTTITGVNLEGNILSLDIEYSGGCQDHVFDFIGAGMVMKSLPPKRTVKLIHNSNGDSCRELVSETIKFDIRALAYAEKSGSEITLLLDGVKDPISYIYP